MPTGLSCHKQHTSRQNPTRRHAIAGTQRPSTKPLLPTTLLVGWSEKSLVRGLSGTRDLELARLDLVG